MKSNPCPGYEASMLAAMKGSSDLLIKAREENSRLMHTYTIPEDMKIEDRMIPVDEDGTERAIRIFTPGNAGEKPPIVMDLHGGGWRNGNLDLDNFRCIELASKIPAIVVSVDYRLANGKDIVFPTPLMDCYHAFAWIHEHAEELGGDPARIGLLGNSAGANMAEGISLYSRDHNGPKSTFTVLVCPPLSNEFTRTASYHQWYDYKLGPDTPKLLAEPNYLGGYDGYKASYYAFPLNCPDLAGLEPHMIVAAEYDTLRDDAFKYAGRLLESFVQCEFFCAARVGHCYNCIPGPYTDQLHNMIAAGFQREFKMAPFYR